MIRFLLPNWLLVATASVALAAVPCQTREEAFAEAVYGFFLVQELSADRCDEALGGDAFRALHARITTAYAAEIGRTTELRTGYFRRAHGAAWEAEHARVRTLTAEMLNLGESLDSGRCGDVKNVLERRLAIGWEPIRQHLNRRVDGIAGHDQNICKP